MKSKITKFRISRADPIIQRRARRESTNSSTTTTAVIGKNRNYDRSLRKLRRRLPISTAKAKCDPRSLAVINTGDKKKIIYPKKSETTQMHNVTVPASETPLSNNTDKFVVSDDESFSNMITSADNCSKSRKTKAETNSAIGNLSPLASSPPKLKTSQIHSKKYPFPHKLFDLIEKASMDDQSSKVVSWSSDGKSFIIHNHSRFATEFLPTYFGHTQLRSFDRQLNYWGFDLVSPRRINNKSCGGKSWKHSSFQAHRRDLLKDITRKSGESSYKNKKMKKKSKKTANSSVAKSCRNIPAPDSGGKTTASFSRKMNNGLFLESIKDNTISPLCFPPRMVSPIYGFSYASARTRIAPNDDIVSDFDVSEGNVDRQESKMADNDSCDFFADIQDEFLPLFPLEMFNVGNYKERDVGTVVSTGAKHIALIPPPALSTDPNITLRSTDNNRSKSCPEVAVFEGNTFHSIDTDINIGLDSGAEEYKNMGMDVNMNMNMNMNMKINMELDVDVDMDMDLDIEANLNMDEAELFLKLIEDKDGNKNDSKFLTSSFASEVTTGIYGGTVDRNAKKAANPTARA